MENNEDALLREDKEGTPESGKKNTAPSQCNELMAQSFTEQDDGRHERIVPRQRRHLFRGNAGPQNGRIC